MKQDRNRIKNHNIIYLNGKIYPYKGGVILLREIKCQESFRSFCEKTGETGHFVYIGIFGECYTTEIK